MLVAYCRVSGQEQSLDLQEDSLKELGCKKFFREKASGANTERPELKNAIEFCREGDTLCVWRLDRVGRSTKHLIEVITLLNERGIQFKSVNENIDTSTSTGKLIFHLFASLAEFERDLIRERTIAGLKSAKERGRLGGRPKLIDNNLLDQIQRMYSSGIRVKSISNQLKISVPTIYRYLNKEKGG